MKPTLRRWFLSLHLWIGLTLGLFIVSQAISGSILDWRPQIEPLISSRLLVVEPGGVRQSLDVLVARARAAHPTSELDYVRQFKDPTASVFIRFTNKDFVYLNPYTAEVLGMRNRYGHFFGWLEGFHRFLMLDQKVGQPIIGTIAGIFAVSIICGMALWWPASRKALRAGLTFNPVLTGRARSLNWHKTLGAYAGVILLFSSLSGMPQGLEWVKSTIYAVTGTEKDLVPKFKKASAGEFVGMELMAKKIQALVPAAREMLIHFPMEGMVEAFAIPTDAPHPNARSMIWMNQANPAEVEFLPYDKSSLGTRLIFWALSLHMGLVGGVTVQILLFLGALSVPVLAYTGIASYLKRRASAEVRSATIST